MPKVTSHVGSLTTDGTEQTVGGTYTDGKMRQWWIDCNAMVDGDQFRVRILTTVNSVESCYREWLLEDDALSEPVLFVPGFGSMVSYRLTLQRMSATNRAFGYQVETLE